ncbi:hypothetical protein [Pseudomonas xionganensis]|uniref:Uncharacterized protein n=1 Tax=Pseudomonas xionganensis TaxID=2654845 RepID=A0A6I4KTG6_9PSED|nr:hypothetical protein [Pseudomonas xionganensis]MVW75397.1 hypothetical protein [Pseudomonas xionganensis]
MLINGGPINSAPINGASGAVAAPEPEYVVAGISYRWRLRVTVGGVDLSDQVLGVTDTDREGGAAGVGGLELYLPPGPVVPSDWVGRSVTLDFIWTTEGVTHEERRYTGQILAPSWDAANRILACELSDNLQQRVEALSVAEIDALTGGFWSADVFEPVEGRSRWDYALERMSTRTASLDCSPTGELRVSSWYAMATPHYVFGPGTTLDGSVSLQLPDLSRLTNHVVIEADYRYSRLRQKNESWSWVGGGFCGWYFPDNKELPTIEMIEDAVSSTGSQLLKDPSWDLLPPSDIDPCLTGQPWVNNFTDLLLGAQFRTGRRWVQSITERYTLTVEAPASIAQAGPVVARVGGAFEVESAQAETWGSTPFDSGLNGHTDSRDETRRQAFFAVLLRQALAQLVDAHRATRISLSLPTPMAAGIDLTHTLQLDDQGIAAQGRVTRVRDVYDHSGGTAITTLELAVMRGGGAVNDALVPPASVDEPQPPGISPTSLPTQLGGRSGVPEYDEDLPGFAGNYGSSDIADPIRYPRRFKLTVDEIPAEQRDELPVPIAATYSVAIPNDLLEL